VPRLLALGRTDPAKNGYAVTLNDLADVAGLRDPDPDRQNEVERRLRLTPASSIAPCAVRWVWDRRVPIGPITLIPGRADFTVAPDLTGMLVDT
jgi:hypothetical protein